MNAPLPLAVNDPAARTHGVPIARADLVRFGIRTDVPPALAMLIVDIFERLPDPEALPFITRLSTCLRAGADLCLVPPLFLQWLLADPVHGLVNLARRADVREAIERVSRDVLALQSIGGAVEPTSFKVALFSAEIAQSNAWNAYRHTSSAPHQQRIEWMVAAAAADAVKPQLPCSLTSSMQSAAVAWAASGKSSFDFYRAIVKKLLALIAEQSNAPALPAACIDGPIAAGDRVTFDDAHEGPQTGTVIGLTNGNCALVEVDHSLPGITWNVPVTDLVRLDQVAA